MTPNTLQSPPVLDPTAETQANKLRAAILQAIKALAGLGIQLGAKSNTATAGAAALPTAPAGFVTITFPDGSAGKVPYYAP